MPHHMDPSSLSPSARQAFKLIEFDEDEILISEIRKHWFGLLLVYLAGSFVTAILLAAAVTLVAIDDSAAAGTGLTTLRMPFILICFLTATLAVIATAIAAYLYRANVVLVTSDKLAQLLTPSLFNRKISQLSIGDVQDVSVHQRGIFPHIFNYGTIVIETAGEQQNYTFTYTPHPYEAAKLIVNSHEENLKLHGN